MSIYFEIFSNLHDSPFRTVHDISSSLPWLPLPSSFSSTFGYLNICKYLVNNYSRTHELSAPNTCRQLRAYTESSPPRLNGPTEFVQRLPSNTGKCLRSTCLGSKCPFRHPHRQVPRKSFFRGRRRPPRVEEREAIDHWILSHRFRLPIVVEENK